MSALVVARTTIIRRTDPAVVRIVWPHQKTVGYGVGPKKMSEHYAYLAVHPTHVNLGCNYGARLDDGGLLDGTGQNMRKTTVARRRLYDPAARPAAPTGAAGALRRSAGPSGGRQPRVVALVPAERRGRDEEQQADDGEPEQALDDCADDGDHQPDDEQQSEEAQHGDLHASAVAVTRSLGPSLVKLSTWSRTWVRPGHASEPPRRGCTRATGGDQERCRHGLSAQRTTRYDSMTYRRTGRSGLDLPAISLGLWHNFGDDMPFDRQRAILRRAFDLGITHFDLANNYGPPYGSAETNFGRHLADDFAPVPRRAGHLDQGRLRHVARPLRPGRRLAASTCWPASTSR